MNYTVDAANKYIADNRNKVNSKHRHNFHLMPPIGWMNDPNGVNFYEGHYHVFYQFYPYDSKWGPMHWGHARSEDLLTWEELPVALAPDLEHEDGCFSGGSAIFKDKLYLLYTSHFETGYKKEEQSIAISNDGGFTFEKYMNKPVLTINELPEHASKIDFRDPNPVTINNENYVLIGSTNHKEEGQFLVYKTNDYVNHEYFTTIGPNRMFGTIAECPDLFELDGKFVLLFSATDLKQEGNRFKNVNSSLYAIGDFDLETKEFIIEHMDELDAGHHFYAPQSLLNDKGERIMIAWMDMWAKPYFTDLNGDGWTGSMTIGRKLSIVNNRLIQTPISTEAILNNKVDITNKNILKLSKSFRLEASLKNIDDTSFSFKASNSNYFEIIISNNKIYLDTSKTTLYPMEERYIELIDSHELNLTLIMDQSSLELFVEGYDKTITTKLYFDEEGLSLDVKNISNLIDLNIKEFL